MSDDLDKSCLNSSTLFSDPALGKIEQFQVQKRDGSFVLFDIDRVIVALEKAFCADLQLSSITALDDFYRREISEISRRVHEKFFTGRNARQWVHIEEIQDLVEILLMQHAHYSVAKKYILYRDKQAQARALRQ